MSVDQQERTAQTYVPAVLPNKQRPLRTVAIIVLLLALALGGGLAIVETNRPEGGYDPARAIAAQTARLDGLAAHHGATVIDTAARDRYNGLAEYYGATTTDLDEMGQQAEALRFERIAATVAPDETAYLPETLRFERIAATATAQDLLEYLPEAIRFNRIADRHRALIR